MIFSGVRLPDEILIARERGTLVVFAGAGVSVPPPSNLPLFNGLAAQICGRTVDPGKEDHFLGKLARAGTNVHAAAAALLCNERTRPTQLHHEILRLFGSATNVRIVTTNLDNHFSSASSDVFDGVSIRQHQAPALPLGDDFHGLVYVHGSAAYDPQSLVLTDSDFGSAYLTRGWAKDFLIPLFSNYTVLFVGYSHSDVTMTYLARGLRQSRVQRRWALVPSTISNADRETWGTLDISLVDYPIDAQNTENPHHALTGLFADWGAHNSESTISKSRKVQKIARGLPPENLETSEYLRYCLGQQRLAEDFCKAIRHPAWVGWMDARKHFDGLFEPGARDAQADTGLNALAYWLCTYVRRRYPDVLLGLLLAHGHRMTEAFGSTLAQCLWRDHRKTPDRRFSTWLSLLLSHCPGGIPDRYQAYLLQQCRIPRDLSVALRLLELITTPEIRVERGLNLAEIATGTRTQHEPLELKVVWPREAKHYLSDAWTKVLAPHISVLGEPVAQIIIKQFIQAHHSLKQLTRDRDCYYALSWHRSSVASHEQDSYRDDECTSCMIDILRDIFEYWISTAPAIASARIDGLWATQVHILQRIAIHSVGIEATRSADDKLRWLLDHNLVYRVGMKKEVFDVLSIAYATASVKFRRRLLRKVDQGYAKKGRGTSADKSIDYEKFNLLVWLHRSDENCSLVNGQLAKLRELHPDFGEREYPQFDHWHKSGGFSDEASVDIEKVLSAPPEQYINELLERLGNLSQVDRWHDLRELPPLFAKNKEWARGFVSSLVHRACADPTIWSSVFSAWREGKKSAADWNWILDVLSQLPANEDVYSAAATFISHEIFKSDQQLDDATIDRAAALIDRAWDLCSLSLEPPDDSFKDWLTSAINHVGGSIGQFWVHYCSQVYKRSVAAWAGIPAPLRLRIQSAIGGTNRTRVYARIAMTPWIGYFFSWDRDFSESQLLPILDWDRDPIVAQQSWSVLLGYNRGTSVEFEMRLLPYYKQFANRMMPMLKGTTERSEQFDERALSNLGHNLAAVAVVALNNPIDSGFFRDFLPLLPDSVRGGLAEGIGDFLERLGTDKRHLLWIRWLRKYLDLRLIGIPVALSPLEASHMLGWCVHLGDDFPEAVDRTWKLEQEPGYSARTLEELVNGPLPSRFPLHVCRFFIAELRAEKYPSLTDEQLSLRNDLAKTISGTDELRLLDELLYSRGWDGRG